MAMLAPVNGENFGRLYGSKQPISAHFTPFNSSDQLQRKRSSIFQEALISTLQRLCELGKAAIEAAEQQDNVSTLDEIA